jgi:hypothetical protein
VDAANPLRFNRRPIGACITGLSPAQRFSLANAAASAIIDCLQLERVGSAQRSRGYCCWNLSYTDLQLHRASPM